MPTSIKKLMLEGREYLFRRNRERKRNYKKGRFGNRRKQKQYTNWFERKFVLYHLLPDRTIAKILGSSVNGIQALRWRIKCNYLGLYK